MLRTAPARVCSGSTRAMAALSVYTVWLSLSWCSAVRDVCSLEATTVFPSISGRCRHLPPADARLGAANREVARLTGAPAYADATGDLVDVGLAPSARVVSNALLDEAPASAPPSVNGGSLLFIYFGQFLDHDMTLVEVFNFTTDLEHRFDIAVPRGDPHMRDAAFIPFARSRFDRDAAGVRRFRNVQTPWLDLSQVYGATDEVSTRLRALDGSGRLRSRMVGAHEMLELNSVVGVELEHNSAQAFACGDIRCNEHPVLLALTTLFMREHNRLAAKYRAALPNADDDEVFHRARLENIHNYQQIVYEEWLPKLLGRANMQRLLGRYTGYFPHVDPRTNELFRLAAFRFGHSGVRNTIALTDADNAPVTRLDGVAPGVIDANGHVRVSKVFFRPDLMFTTQGRMLDFCLNGVQHQVHNRIDLGIADVLRNELFREVADRTPLDLISLNLQRARDHGLPSFDEEREALGLPPLRCGNRLACVVAFTGDVQVARRLLRVYGDWTRVDAFVAGLAEKRFGDGQLGRTWTVVIADQFRRMRDGDRFHYAATPSAKTRLHDILNRNLIEGRRDAVDVFDAASNRLPADLVGGVWVAADAAAATAATTVTFAR